MPNLERGRVKETRPFYFLSFFNCTGRPLTCQLVTCNLLKAIYLISGNSIPFILRYKFKA